jgi:peptide/nickel transport system substrate-binding protein
VKKTYRGFGVVAALTAAALTLTGCAVPEDEAVVTPTPTGTEEAPLAPLVTVAWNDLISEFNSSSVTGNNVANGIITYMTSSGFNYYDSAPALVKNTDFGSYEIVNENPLTVKYTINDGVVWSDGVDIDGADLLLNWAAVFGYGGDADAGTYPFAHANPRPTLASKLPTVEGRSITFEYDVQYVDWELQFGIGVAAHGTTMMAYPDLSPADAKAQLVAAIQAGDWDFLTPVAQQWSTGYQSVNTPSNPLVLLSSGPYIVEELVEDSYVTLVINDKYTWGPKPKYERITVREIGDSTAAVQAVENGEVDIASGQPTPDVLALVEALANARFATGDEAAYEHIDLTFNNGGPFDPRSYGGDEAKARAVRTAFLMTIPREEIIEKLIRPLNPNAELRNSFLVIPGAPSYDNIVANNGSAIYRDNDVDARIELAKQLLADNGVSTPIDVKFWYPEGNVRRGQEFELIQLSAAKAGFNVIDDSEPTWAFTGADINPHDAVIFAWASTSLAVTGSDQIYSTGKPSNFNGYSNTKVNDLLNELDTALDPARQAAIQLEVEKELWADAYGTTIFQFPGLTWWNSGVGGIEMNPLVPYFFWNFWDWNPVAG